MGGYSGYGGPPSGPGGTGGDKRSQAKAAFMTFDTDRSGFIDRNEFEKCVRMLGFAGSYEDASMVFMIVDQDGDGQVRENEFVEHWVLNH